MKNNVGGGGGDLKINLNKGKKNLSLCQKAQRLGICDKF